MQGPVDPNVKASDDYTQLLSNQHAIRMNDMTQQKLEEQMGASRRNLVTDKGNSLKGTLDKIQL